MAKRSVGLAVPMSEADYERMMRSQRAGVDPIDNTHQSAPGPTRSTSCPYFETNQRKPYQPVEDYSTPSLDDGVSFRQKL